MSMREMDLAKYTFLIGAPFFVLAFAGSYIGFLDYPFSSEAPLILNYTVRLIFGIGGVSLLANFVLMWRHMFNSRQWGWFISTLFGAFISTLLYYRLHYVKHCANSI
jgi:phosphate/sulfate permease